VGGVQWVPWKGEFFPLVHAGFCVSSVGLEVEGREEDLPLKKSLTSKKDRFMDGKGAWLKGAGKSAKSVTLLKECVSVQGSRSSAESFCERGRHKQRRKKIRKGAGLEAMGDLCEKGFEDKSAVCAVSSSREDGESKRTQRPGDKTEDCYDQLSIPSECISFLFHFNPRTAHSGVNPNQWERDVSE